MSVSQGRVLRDGRRLPFFAITKAAMRCLRAAFEGTERKTAIAIYATLVEASNDEGSDSFTATRARIAARAGVHPSTLTDYADRLAEAGLLAVERRREGSANLPNLWTLTDPPEAAAEDGGSSSQTRRGRRARRGGVLVSDEEGSAQAGTPSSSQTTEVLVSDEEGSSSQTRRLEERLEEQEAANAAAPHAPAPAPAPARGPARAAGPGSSMGTGPDSSEFWDRAAAALEVAGFPTNEILTARLAVLERLRRSHIPLGDIIWTRIGPQMGVWRTDPGVAATDPAGVLAFALGQRGDVAYTTTTRPRPASAEPPTNQPAGGGTLRRVTFPPPTEQARDGWTWVREQFEERVEGAEQWASWLHAIHPLRVVGGTLEITGPPHATTWIEARLVPALTTIVREQPGRDLRWVDPTTIALPDPRRAA